LCKRIHMATSGLKNLVTGGHITPGKGSQNITFIYISKVVIRP
jgi:hypothetical protein